MSGTYGFMKENSNSYEILSKEMKNSSKKQEKRDKKWNFHPDHGRISFVFLFYLEIAAVG